MRVAVLGASGRTGRWVVAEAARRGHAVVSVVRRPGSGPDGATERVADGRDPVALAAAVAGCDAIAFAIGPSPQSEDHTVVRESLTALLRAVAGSPLRRLVLVSASGPFIDRGDDPLLRYLAKPIVQRILREPFRDFVAAEPLVRHSGLDWTIIRPPQLADGLPRGRYRSGRDRGVPWGIRIRRADLAVAVVDALEDPDSIGHTLTVAA